MRSSQYKAAEHPVILVLSRAIGCVGMGLLMLNIFVQIFDTVCRWLFLMPLSWVADLYELTLPIAIAACFPLTVAQGGMIAIAFLGDALGGLYKRLLNALGAAALLAVLAIITWQSCLYALEAQSNGRASFLLGIWMAPTWFVVMLFFGFAALIQLVIVVTVETDIDQPRSVDEI